MVELPSLHEELLAALSELEAITAEPVCDDARLSSLRYRLTCVSARRRQLVDQLCVEMAERAPEALAAQLHALRRSNLEARIATTKHIGIWTPREIARDWAGYRRASAAMRARMREQIAAERELLYPRFAAAA